jgi:hypothetical protein
MFLGFAGKLYVPFMNSVCCGKLLDGTIEESAGSYLTCEKLITTNRQNKPVKRKYFLLAITID